MFFNAAGLWNKYKQQIKRWLYFNQKIGDLDLIDNQKNNFKIWFKNEYLVTWLNEEPYVTSPDIICLVDSKTGDGLTPWSDDFSKNRAVAVIGAKNAPIWYTKKGLEIFGPRHFGFDFDYQSF